MNRKEQFIFGILGLLISAGGCIAAWLALPSIFPPQPTADPPTQFPSLRIMDNIYNALRFETLVADKEIYTSGEEVIFSFKLANLSNQTLVIPENNDYSRTYYLVGLKQHWFERLGTDSEIPSLDEQGQRREWGRYTHGSYIFDVDKRVIEPGESIPFKYYLRDTSGFPPGMYRFYVEYQRLDGSVIQTLSVDFEIR